MVLMKSNYFEPKMLRAILVIFGLSAMFFSSCENNPGIIGLDVIPSDDQILVQFDTSTSLSARTILKDSIRSDEDNLSTSKSYSLLGSYIDPVFGKSKADFITQIRLSKNLVDFGENFFVDSLRLFLEIENLYGDLRQTGSQNIYVYRLTDTISKDTSYYSNMDVSGYYDQSQLLGQLTISPNMGDSIIAISIDTEPFKELLSDTANLVDNETFLKVFKGIYVTTDEVDYLGNIMSLSMLSDYSRLRLYYHNYPEEFPFVPANASSTFDFLINSECARINLFYHDYENASNPIQHINDSIFEDSLIYIQAMGGVKVKVELNDIEKWRDSVGVVINNAKLIIPVLENSGDIFSPVPLLSLSYLNDAGDNVLFPDLYHNGSYYSEYFNGVFNKETQEYEFNIALYIQGIINGSIPLSGFYIQPYVTESAVMANRVILKGSNASEGMRINITYIKL